MVLNRDADVLRHELWWLQVAYDCDGDGGRAASAWGTAITSLYPQLNTTP